jgi:hypothetical protein
VLLEGLGQLKISNDLIGNRISRLPPCCSILPLIIDNDNVGTHELVDSRVAHGTLASFNFGSQITYLVVIDYLQEIFSSTLVQVFHIKQWIRDCLKSVSLFSFGFDDDN